MTEITLKLTRPIAAPIAATVNAVEMAQQLALESGDFDAFMALGVVVVLCQRGHQALLTDDVPAPDRDRLLAQLDRLRL